MTVSIDSHQSGEGSYGGMLWTGRRERKNGEREKQKSEVKRKLMREIKEIPTTCLLGRVLGTQAIDPGNPEVHKMC